MRLFHLGESPNLRLDFNDLVESTAKLDFFVRIAMSLK
jgi:hypothetical protein